MMRGKGDIWENPIKLSLLRGENIGYWRKLIKIIEKLEEIFDNFRTWI